VASTGRRKEHRGAGLLYSRSTGLWKKIIFYFKNQLEYRVTKSEDFESGKIHLKIYKHNILT
jgi:hypothetical protein